MIARETNPTPEQRAEYEREDRKAIEEFEENFARRPPPAVRALERVRKRNERVFAPIRKQLEEARRQFEPFIRQIKSNPAFDRSTLALVSSPHTWRAPEQAPSLAKVFEEHERTERVLQRTPIQSTGYLIRDRLDSTRDAIERQTEVMVEGSEAVEAGVEKVRRSASRDASRVRLQNRRRYEQAEQINWRQVVVAAVLGGIITQGLNALFT